MSFFFLVMVFVFGLVLGPPAAGFLSRVVAGICFQDATHRRRGDLRVAPALQQFKDCGSEVLRDFLIQRSILDS